MYIGSLIDLKDNLIVDCGRMAVLSVSGLNPIFTDTIYIYFGLLHYRAVEFILYVITLHFTLRVWLCRYSLALGRIDCRF